MARCSTPTLQAAQSPGREAGPKQSSLTWFGWARCWLICFIVVAVVAGRLRADVVITNPLPAPAIIPPGHLELDVDNNGTADFRFEADIGGNLTVRPIHDGVAIVALDFTTIARPFMVPEVITCDSNFRTGTLTMLSSFFGTWFGLQDRFLGLRFNRDGRPHLAWARLDISLANAAPTVESYAYNDIPEGEPGGCTLPTCFGGAPGINCPSDLTRPCGSATGPTVTGTPQVTGGCNNAVTFEDEVSGDACMTVITRTWTATSGIGQSGSCTQTITVVDQLAPVLSVPDDVTIDCGASTDPQQTGQATATDACVSGPMVTFDDATSGICPTILTRTWTATDACGNSTSTTQTITLEDNTPPVLSVPPDITLPCGSSTDPNITGQATANDACDPSSFVTFSDVVDGTCPATIVRTWTAIDACEHSVSATQTITLADDETEPGAGCTVTKLIPADAAFNSRAGWSVDINGEVVILGAPRFQVTTGDAAYIFRREGLDWVEVFKLTGMDTAVDQEAFGYAVAIEGDTAVVGAPFEDAAGANAGAVYVFGRTTTLSGEATWELESRLTADDASAGQQFGIDVALAGDRLVVGARGDGANGFGAGAAYVFERSMSPEAGDDVLPGGSVWSQAAKLIAGDADAGDAFGTSVGIDGSFIAVGAPGDDAAGLDGGAAYVFQLAVPVLGSGWTQVTKLLPAPATFGSGFGDAIAIDGGRVLVGAPREIAPGNPQAGAGYVFGMVNNEPSMWPLEQKLRASPPRQNDQFGVSVDIEGDVALVGVPNRDQHGAAMLFRFDGQAAMWSLFDTLVAFDGEPGERFGQSVALDGDTAIIGAPYDDDRATRSGAAYIAVLAGADCNENGVLDICDILNGTSEDENQDQVPDECALVPAPFTADVNGDGHIDGRDIQFFIECITTSPAAGPHCAWMQGGAAPGHLFGAEFDFFVNMLLDRHDGSPVQATPASDLGSTQRGPHRPEASLVP